MKILLININPVVSRLFGLCTRDEHIGLDEVVSADAVEKFSYDIVLSMKLLMSMMFKTYLKY